MPHQGRGCSDILRGQETGPRIESKAGQPLSKNARIGRLVISCYRDLTGTVYFWMGVPYGETVTSPHHPPPPLHTPPPHFN